MRQWLNKHVQRFMIRAIVYKFFSRMAYTLTIALLWDHFLNDTPRGLSICFALMGVIFLLGAWIARLRMDGYRLPRLPAKRLRRRDRTDIFYGDMIDYVDEPVVNFEDLDTGEQDTCLVLVDLACAAVYFVASCFV